jgi:RNA polymerase sigma-B factor
MAVEPKDSPAYSRARDELVTIHLPLVEHLARRFRDRGEPHDDLVQVGTIGLIKAVDRFDPDRGVEFSTYATPTIVGEIKRHFRDRGWSIRVPRRLQELRIGIGSTSEALSHQLGRTPTVADIAEAMGISQEDVLAGLESARAYSSVSLDAGSGEDGTSSLADTVAATDTDLAQVDNRETLRVAIESLPERERQIVLMRFFGHKTLRR